MRGAQHGVSIQSSIKTINLGKTAAMKIRTDLNLGDVFRVSITYHIPESSLNLLNGYDFYF